jgi:hypothetical protein
MQPYLLLERKRLTELKHFLPRLFSKLQTHSVLEYVTEKG